MDIGRAFGFVTKDESWVTKVLIGGLASLIPLVGTFVTMGYSYRVARNVAAGSERPLPEWNEFGDFLTRGFLAWVIQLVYLLPAGVLYFLFALVTAGAAAATTNAEGEGGQGALIALCLFPLLLIFALACGLASLAAIMRYLATDEFSQAFKFGEVFANLRANIGNYLMLVLVAILAGLAASVGLIACGIGVLFTAFFAQLVIGHATGQLLPQVYPLRSATSPSGFPPTNIY